MTLKELLNTLTKEQAAEYTAVTDKVLWVIDTIIDPNDFSSSWVTAIENRLDEINAG
jgi:hypothetical protein